MTCGRLYVCDTLLEGLAQQLQDLVRLSIRGQGHAVLARQSDQHGRLDRTREMHVEAHLGEALEARVEIHGVSFPVIDA